MSDKPVHSPFYFGLIWAPILPLERFEHRLELVLRRRDRLRRPGQFKENVTLRPRDDCAEQPIARLRRAWLSHHLPAAFERPAQIEGRHGQFVDRLRLLVRRAVSILELTDPSVDVGLNAAAQVCEYSAFGPLAVALSGWNQVRGRAHLFRRPFFPTRRHAPLDRD